MKYEKAKSEVIQFDNSISFLATSPGCPSDYASAEDALKAECGGFTGNTNSFSCDPFRGYGSDAPKGASVTISGNTYTYVFETHGNSGRWYCSSV